MSSALSTIFETLPSCQDVPWEPAMDVWDSPMLMDGGMGLMTQYGARSSHCYDAYVFMEEQYRRFGLLPPQEDMLQWCWNFAFYSLDQLDPYVLYSGCTDVIKTNEHLYYQFATRHEETDFADISADNLEVYRVWPEGVRVYEQLMAYPGLNSYTHPEGHPQRQPVGAMFFEYIHEYFDEHFTHVKNDDHPECYQEELDLIKKYGDKANHTAHLGIWAAIMWMIGPEGKGWRKDYNPIFQMCYDEGACLLHDWTFYSPEYFRRFERPVKSCALCGTKDWCVELVSVRLEHKVPDEVAGEAVYMCENCNSTGLAFPGRTCGSKMCSITSCKNHPTFSSDLVVQRRFERQQDAINRYGELREAGGYHLRELPGIVFLNHKAIEQYSNQISSDVGSALTKLLTERI